MAAVSERSLAVKPDTGSLNVNVATKGAAAVCGTPLISTLGRWSTSQVRSSSPPATTSVLARRTSLFLPLISCEEEKPNSTVALRSARSPPAIRTRYVLKLCWVTDSAAVVPLTSKSDASTSFTLMLNLTSQVSVSALVGET